MKIKRLSGMMFWGLVIALTPFAAAQAVSIDITYSGSAIFSNGVAGYEQGGIAPNPNSETSLARVLIGGDSVTTTSPVLSIGSLFNVWCVDIYHWMIGRATYTIETGNALADDLQLLRGNGALRVAQLLELADGVYSTLNSKEDNAAFQLAVWEITYGTADNAGLYHINTTDSKFKVDESTANSAFTAKANGWLTNLGKKELFTGNYELSYLSDGEREYTQDLVVFTARPQTFGASSIVPVPEPSTIMLLGLAGLGFFKRKKA